jgi:pimeloyl-ACP methyl ester carboxylesterase
MLARLQQSIVITTLIAGLAWVIAIWNTSPGLAIAGLCWLWLFPAFVLGCQFLAVRHINRNDPAPLAPWREIAAAWLGECVVAARVFYWRQPFRSHCLPDNLTGSPLRGVVFIHGFVCNRGLWTPWLAQMQAQQRPFIAVNLEPVLGSIDDYVPLIEQAVQRITMATGQAPVLVCHSMGGLAARAWLRQAGDRQRIAHVVTIGSPHRGTWLGRFAHSLNGRQMNLASRWLQQLERDEPPGTHALFTCWYSNCDNIVLPASTATLPGADNRLVAGQAHVELAFDPVVMQETLALIAGR